MAKHDTVNIVSLFQLMLDHTIRVFFSLNHIQVYLPLHHLPQSLFAFTLYTDLVILTSINMGEMTLPTTHRIVLVPKFIDQVALSG